MFDRDLKVNSGSLKSIIDHSIFINDPNMQFHLRPTGSATPALIYLTSVITSLLTPNKFVRLIALDFSKAFDTLDHSTLITNMASLQLDSNHNSLISFFKNRTQSTKFCNKTSIVNYYLNLN